MKYVTALIAAAGLLALAGCNANPPREQPLCSLPEGSNLTAAMEQARFDLHTGCAARYDAYFERMLDIARGDPRADNRRQFSEFLEWSVDEGLLSRRQARERYNRYFNVKYVSLQNDFSVCSATCPKRGQLLGSMRGEREDKKLGLLEISGDRATYQRADRLYHETELVLEATCLACEAR
jgi:hypothetical protein